MKKLLITMILLATSLPAFANEAGMISVLDINDKDAHIHYHETKIINHTERESIPCHAHLNNEAMGGSYGNRN